MLKQEPSNSLFGQPSDDDKDTWRFRCDRFFDIETESWDKYVIGGVIDNDGYQEFRDEQSLFENLLASGGVVWSWNGGRFDILWWAEIARNLGIKCDISTAGPRVTRLKCGDLELRDSVALIPMSLAKGAGIAGITVSKNTGLDCICGDTCGGYCAIKRGMSDSDYCAVAKYLRVDCEAGWQIMHAIIAESERCNYRLRGTVGASSYATAKHLCSLDDASWPSVSTYLLARDGYYGGRTEDYRPVAAWDNDFNPTDESGEPIWKGERPPEGESGFGYDINSAYPAALVETELPIGVLQQLSGDKARDAYEWKREGIYRARVAVPHDMYIPPLPYRLSGGRVTYPVGTFDGAWTRIELEYAESLGVEVDIRYSLSWMDSSAVLAPLMEHVWSCRDRAANEGNESLRAWHKWVANSCTGKLAESPEKERVIIHPEEVKHCPGGECSVGCRGGCRGKNRCCNRRCSKRCGAFRMLDKDGTIWAAPFFRISNCAHVHWAAYLTAATRIKLHKQLLGDDDGESAIYCDTDSVYCTVARNRDIGDGLGLWKFEGRIRNWICLAPKVYRYDGISKAVLRAKGLPEITEEDFRAFATGGEVVRTKGVKGLKSAARSGSLFQRKRLARSNLSEGKWFGGRLLGKEGKTFPTTVQELERCR